MMLHASSVVLLSNSGFKIYLFLSSPVLACLPPCRIYLVIISSVNCRAVFFYFFLGLYTVQIVNDAPDTSELIYF